MYKRQLFVLLTFGIGLLVVWVPLAVVTIWFIYRIVRGWTVSYTHLRAHETVLDLVCRLLLEKKKR